MSLFFSTASRTDRRKLLARCALICALALPFAAHAQDDQHELSEKVSTKLEQLKPLTDAKNWDGAITLLDSLSAGLAADSYDVAILSDIRAKIYLQKGDFSKAVAPMETALHLGEVKNYFNARARQDMIYYLAQIYYQEAAASKNAAAQAQGFAKANTFLERWLANNDKPVTDQAYQEAVLFHSSLLYNQAVINPDKIDLALLKRAQAEVETGLHLAAHPKESFYSLLLAIYQQQGDYQRLGETLELVVKKYPNKKDYWPQLAGVYLNLAQDKDEQKSREYNVRAILSIERAQALGYMKTPKENYNLVGVYFNVGQFGRATELLHSGLRDGSIDNEQKNWELLAYSYQQVDLPYKAIEVLKEAGEQFPKSGQIDYQIAQIFYGLNKAADAFRHLNAGLTKGNVEKPAAAYGFLAYVAFELGDFQAALDAIAKAQSYPESAKDTQLPRLKQAVEDAIRERDAQRAANQL